MTEMRIPGFTASASLHPTTRHHCASPLAAAAGEPIAPQMEMPDPSDTHDQPPIHFHPPPRDDRPPWFLGDNRPPWAGSDGGSGGGGSGAGSGASAFDECIEDCRFWYRADNRLCNLLLDDDAKSKCAGTAGDNFAKCWLRCKEEKKPWWWPFG